MRGWGGGQTWGQQLKSIEKWVLVFWYFWFKFVRLRQWFEYVKFEPLDVGFIKPLNYMKALKLCVQWNIQMIHLRTAISLFHANIFLFIRPHKMQHSSEVKEASSILGYPFIASQIELFHLQIEIEAQTTGGSKLHQPMATLNNPWLYCNQFKYHQTTTSDVIPFKAS